MNYHKKLSFALQAMKEAGAEKAQAELIITKKHELNTESGEITLFRTNIDNMLKLKQIKNNKQGTLTLNKIDDSDILEGIEQLKMITEASSADDAYDIAEPVTANICIGNLEPNIDEVYDVLKEFIEDMNKMYPQVSGDIIISYDYKKRVLMNSMGLDLVEENGSYEFKINFSATEGEKLTSFNYTAVKLVDLKKKLMEVGSVNDILNNSVKELNARALGEKFEGDVIITPDCLIELLYDFEDVALTDEAIISGSSKYLDKFNQQVASDKLVWYSNPRSVSAGMGITEDGLEAKDMPIIENGILKNYMLSQYGAKKTGLSRSGNCGKFHVIKPGNQSLNDMIKSIDKGILFCRFSGAYPSADGSFSGVAKNSFYIKNGEIAYPIEETMVSGNLFSLLKDIKAISSETVDAGDSILPWIHTTNVTISG